MAAIEYCTFGNTIWIHDLRVPKAMEMLTMTQQPKLFNSNVRRLRILLVLRMRKRMGVRSCVCVCVCGILCLICKR